MGTVHTLQYIGRHPQHKPFRRTCHAAHPPPPPACGRRRGRRARRRSRVHQRNHLAHLFQLEQSGGERSEEHTLNSSHTVISYAVFCLKKKKKKKENKQATRAET